MLATCHSIYLVIDNNRRQVQIPSGRVNDVIAANGCGISIPHDSYDSQGGLCQFDPGDKRQDPPVGGVQGVEVNIGRYAS
jgi:hypothetical protein